MDRYEIADRLVMWWSLAPNTYLASHEPECAQVFNALSEADQDAAIASAVFALGLTCKETRI